MAYDDPPNDLLARARSRLRSPSGSGRELSRQELAEAVNAYLWNTYRITVSLDGTYVGHLEQGRHRWPAPRRREAFRHVLGARTDAEIGFYIMRGLRKATKPQRGAPPAQRSVHHLVAAQDVDLLLPQGGTLGGSVDDLEENMRRRNLLSATAAAAVSMWAPPAPTTAACIGAADVEAIQRRTIRLRRLDNYLGGADTLTTYAAELRGTETILREMRFSDATGRLLTSVLAEQAQLTGWAAFDSGDTSYAESLFLRSRSAAEHAGDAVLAANALSLLAYQRASSGTPDLAMAAASAAQLDDSAPRNVRALAWERLAFSYAVARHETAAQKALEHAESALHGSNMEQPPDWAAWVDQHEIQIMTGRVWAELHRPLRAIPVLSTALDSFDDAYARDKALYSTWLAAAYIDAGEPEQADALLHSSARLVDGVSSCRPQQRIREVRNRLPPT